MDKESNFALQSSAFVDCLKIRVRACQLHHTFKWLHLTVDLHSYLIQLAISDMKIWKH